MTTAKEVLKSAIVSTCFCIAAFFSVNAQEFVPIPDNLTAEGVPQLPASLKNDLTKSMYRKATSFYKWSQNDGSLMAISPNRRLLYKKVAGEKVSSVDFGFYNSDTTFLQPGLEKNFLYLRDNGNDSPPQLYRYDLETKKNDAITDPSKFERIGWAVWADDGKTYYFSDQRRSDNISKIYVNDLDDKNPRLLLTFPEAGYYVIDANDKFLILKNISINFQAYLVVDLQTQKVTELLRGDRVEGGYLNKAGNGIWYISNEGTDFFDLYSCDLNDKSIKKAGLPPMIVSDFALSKSEKMLAVKMEVGGASSLRLFELNGTALIKELNGPKLPPGIIGNRFDWKNEDEIGFDFNSTKLPSSVKSYNVKTEEITDWTTTDVYPEISDKINDVKLVKWESFDKREISGYMIEPKTVGKEKIPVIIDIHGGITDVSKPVYDGNSAYLAATLKTAIIFANIRGSSGFGRSFEKLDDGEKREDSIRDLQALISWIKKQPNLDANRIAIRTGSYGAFISFALGMREPKRIKGVSAIVPLISIKSYLEGQIERYRKMLIPEFGDIANEKDMERNERLSLLYGNNIERWEVPTLLIAAQEDKRVPISDVDKLFQKLKERKKPVSYVKAKNVGHGFNSYETFLYAKMSEFTFFKSVLK